MVTSSWVIPPKDRQILTLNSSDRGDSLDQQNKAEDMFWN